MNRIGSKARNLHNTAAATESGVLRTSVVYAISDPGQIWSRYALLIAEAAIVAAMTATARPADRLLKNNNNASAMNR